MLFSFHKWGGGTNVGTSAFKIWIITNFSLATLVPVGKTRNLMYKTGATLINIHAGYMLVTPM